PAPSSAEPRDTATLSGAQTLDVAAKGKPQYVPGQIIVKFKPGLRASDVSALAENEGLSVIRHFDVPPVMVKSFGGELYQFKLRGGDTVQDAIARLSGKPNVAYAEPNYKIQLNDPKPTGKETSHSPAPKDGDMPNDLDPRLWGIVNSGQDGGKAGEDVNA